MRTDFDWCLYCCYSITNTKTNATILDVKSYQCFSRLPYNFNYINSSITIKKYSREVSLPYVDFYIQYIVDMLKLEDVIIEKDSLTFKAFKERNKNLLVLTLVRFLFEYIGNEHYKGKNNIQLFESLMKGKCKYKNKLKKFCYFYIQLKDLGNTYWHTGHTPDPSKVKIRSYKDFNNTDFRKINVNDFFYGKK